MTSYHSTDWLTLQSGNRRVTYDAQLQLIAQLQLVMAIRYRRTLVDCGDFALRVSEQWS